MSLRTLIGVSWSVRYVPVGIAFLHIVNTLFDYALYPFVIYSAGPIRGGIIMTILSLFACLAILTVYDLTKKDWLGMEAMRSLRFRHPRNTIEKAVRWLLNRSDPVAFVALSLYYDPFITTVWLRNIQYGGLSRRDWRIFLSSLLLANAFWTISCWLGVNFFLWLWSHTIRLIDGS